MSLSGKLDILKDLRTLNNRSKSYVFILVQLVVYLFIKGGRFKAFFLFRLHEKRNHLKDFITEKEYRKLNAIIAPPYYRCILEDKILFFRYMNGLKKDQILPENLGYATREFFFSLNGEENCQLEKLLENPLDSFVKSHCGCCGQDIFKLRTDQGKIYINDIESCVSEVKHLIREKSVIQKKIIQHPEISRIHENSVNTMRVVTCYDPHNVSVYISMLRVGRSGNFVDNTAAGNLIVGIDQDTGRLQKYAFSMTRLKDMYLTQHPDSGFVFEGHNIPFFREAVDTCRDLHRYFDMFLLLGWDVAFTPTGIIILECNNISDLNAYQAVNGGMRARLLEDLNRFQN